MSEQPVLVSDPDWVTNALGDVSRDLTLRIFRRESPAFHLAVIARRRDANVEHDWNWCATCHVEVPARRVHQSMAQCPFCKQRFDVIHEGTEANERLRESPGYGGRYPGPYYDGLSAVWYEWSLRRIGAGTLPDGALAYDVTRIELPQRNVRVGTKRLTRCERRRLARNGHRGRRGSVRITVMQDVFAREEYEHEAIREHNLEKSGHFSECARMRVHEYRKIKHGVSVNPCRRCPCAITVFAIVYIEHDAPHLMELVRCGLQRAGVHLATLANRQGLCFCPE